MTAPTLDDYHGYTLRRAQEPAHDRPAVTAITIALNAHATLERTIASVQGQTFARVEHVVVDGGSTDGTLDLLARRLRSQDYWLSEPDRGISDALNKGVALARGDYIQFIHADDWLSPAQIERAVAALERSGTGFVFGDLVFYENDAEAFEYKGDPAYGDVLHRRMPALNHPTVLARRDCFARVGLFDLRYRCAMDYDWFLRLHRAGIAGVHDPEIRGHMNHDGVSNLDFHRTIREVRAISIAHGRHPLPAHATAAFQHAKVTAGRVVKARARPLYEGVRRWINPSFRPLRPH